MKIDHELGDSAPHFAWDNAIDPVLSVDPGAVIRFGTRDAANFYYSPDSTAEDVANKGPFKGHPLTGPVYVRGARPGDVLAVEILDIAPSKGFGWTAFHPGGGLLEEDFPHCFLQIWDLSDGGHARMGQRDDIAIPIEAFPGILGTALKEPGAHHTIPPRENGGNMDIKHVTKGAVMYLPVWVEGALFSTGDAHAAQGDGEVCLTAIEMSATMTLRLNLLENRSFREPQFRTAGPLCAGTNTGSYYVTTAHGPDLKDCSRRAMRYMIEHLVEERGLSRDEAYVLCSVCVDLKINELVDAPNWIVSASLPESVFT